MTQPVYYMQTDSKWKNKDYSAKGEKTTIGASGCGPTSMAMVLATWADPKVDPVSECAWALAHGYKAPHSGTYYGYFEPAGARYGLSVTRLNYSNIYGNSTSQYHAQAKAAIDRGDLVIACMGKGNWTSQGHYVLVWDIKGNTIYINDPASTKTSRTRGDYSLFKKQVKYYWTIKRPAHIPGKEDELDMTKQEFLNSLTNEEAYNLMAKAKAYVAEMPDPDWSVKEGWWKKFEEAGIVDGSNPMGDIKRCETTAILGRLGLLPK